MTHQAAIILGASGSVGKDIVAEVLRTGQFSPVVLVVRHHSHDLAQGAAVQELIVPNMNPDVLQQAVEEKLNQLSTLAVGFSALGVGAGTAKLSLEEHRRIDVDLNAAFARALKASQIVRHLVFMSAIGADVNASATGSGAAGMSRYRRVKGEAEATVLRDGPEVISTFRPSTIIGSQHTPGFLSAAAQLLSPLTPAKLRPIRSSEIAQAMVACALQNPTQSAIYSYPEMKDLAAKSKCN